jgi:hypothetical protein
LAWTRYELRFSLIRNPDRSRTALKMAVLRADADAERDVDFMRKPKDCRGGNEEAVRIILADPERHAGLPLEWAPGEPNGRPQRPQPCDA